MRTHFLSTILLLLFIQPSFAASLPDAPHIVVNGEHEIRVTPDTLTISLGISQTGFEVGEARDSVEKRSRELVTAFEKIAIAPKDISSARLNITPHYNWNQKAQIYSGTEVSRTIEVTLRDLSHYDELIRSIIDAGVARIHSTRLSSSREKQIRQEALRGAIADGMKNGAMMVDHLPETLGSVYSIAPRSSVAPHPQARYELAAADRQSAFEPGTIVFKESLQIVFYLDR
ncbi:MAG: SIMPL domain-containing protein [Desulforhopalus sp.]